jgi:hypothetical protein
MSLHVERTGERDRPEDQMERLFAEGFPAFITADQLGKQYIGRVREWFTHQDLILLDDEDEPVATGWGCRCDGRAWKTCRPATPTQSPGRSKDMSSRSSRTPS